MAHAAGAASLPALMKAGNSKLGSAGKRAHLLLVVSGLAVHDCPGRTSGCDGCYAESFRYLHAASNKRGAQWAYSYLARTDTGCLERVIRAELAAHIAHMPLGSRIVVRIHEAGDFLSPEHAAVWRDVAEDFPDVTFYGYSRSWNVPRIASVLAAMNTLENVIVRHSLDSAADWQAHDGRAPVAFIDGRVSNRGKKHPVPYNKGAVTCPAQTGGPGCADCGICWERRLPVQFLRH
jgi:prepilin-type processing-associated H-X9-DG protein